MQYSADGRRRAKTLAKLRPCSAEVNVKLLLRSTHVARFASLALMLLAGAGVAADYQDDWGPVVGSAMPAIDAPDHTGASRALADLAGEKGLLLFVNRSADW